MTNKNTDSDKIKTQSITVNAIIGKIVEAIFTYIALYFFTPVWKKIMGWWKKDKKDESK